jgi:SHS2 domain-containing protein
MYEVFEHTADLGLRVRSPTLESLMEDAARGFTEIVAGDLGQVRQTTYRAFEIPGADPATHRGLPIGGLISGPEGGSGCGAGERRDLR